MDSHASSGSTLISGLDPDVRQRLAEALSKMVPEWMAEPAADWKRVPRPTGVGSYSVNIEPYQGIQSWIAFRKKHANSKELTALDQVLRQRQPELLGYVQHASGSQRIQDCFALLACFSREVAVRMSGSISTDNAISSVLGELDGLLKTQVGVREVLTVLNGLKLPDKVERVALGNDLYIRRLTAEEIADFGSNDISSETRFDITSKFVTAAIVSETPVSIRLTPVHELWTPDWSVTQLHQTKIDNVMAAIHMLKSGRVGILASFDTIRPAILPNMSGHSSAPLVVNPFSFMELSEEEVGRLVTLYNSLSGARRDELSIAAARLLDAESRLSPVDALLDAVIGLEALLNPNDRSELSFRVALNYAYLAKEPERRERYENVRDIQVTRNRVVHGGLNLQSRDASRIHEHCELAKSCLRDATVRFVTDSSLMGQRRLDADFWLDRVLPPRTGE